MSTASRSGVPSQPLGAVQPADGVSQYVARYVRFCLEDETGRKFAYDQFTVVAYKTQAEDDASAGIYLFIKINVGNGECVHIKVYRPKTDPESGQEVLELHSYQLHKTMDDPIEPDSFTPMNISRVVIERDEPVGSAPIQATIVAAISDTRYNPLEANDAVQERLTSVRPAVEKQVGRTFSEFRAVLYLKDTTRYAVKVCVGGEEFIHVGLRHSSGRTKVKFIQLNKTEDDELSLQE